VGEFLVVEHDETSFAYVPDGPEASDRPCAAVGEVHAVDLYDTGLERGFSLDGLAADVRVELHPGEHALTLQGRFCGERIQLADVH
jgi:hypothetical protein